MTNKVVESDLWHHLCTWKESLQPPLEPPLVLLSVRDQDVAIEACLFDKDEDEDYEQPLKTYNPPKDDRPASVLDNKRAKCRSSLSAFSSAVPVSS